MKLLTHLKTARRNLSASRLRTFLAMLGIMVGTASVVALMSGGQLATQQALEQIRGLGTNLMRINFSQRNTQTQKKELTTNISKISIQNLMDMQSVIPDVLQVAPMISDYFPAAYKQQVLNDITVLGTTQNLAKVIGIQMHEGRFIYDLDKSSLFCVIGSKVAKKMNTITPLYNHIRLGDQIYTVIGIAKDWVENSMVGVDIDQSIIIPLPAMLANIPDSKISIAMLQLTQDANIDSMKQAIRKYFQRSFPGYTVTFQSSKELINKMESQQAIFSILLGLIGGISLLVGGIGVMNIMLASVAERHTEIGLRIALGAKPRDVQLMFLMEAAALAVIGGTLGVIIGILATAIIASIAEWSFVFLLWPPLIGFGVSMLISLFFGFYPAYVASQLNPIEILRS